MRRRFDYAVAEAAWLAMVALYREARQAWRQYPSVQEACRLWGMSERGYADAYVSANWIPITISASSSTVNITFTAEDVDAAYRAAVEES